MTSKVPKKKPEHYVSNKEFFAEFVVWKDEIQEARAHDRPDPRMPECIGKKILLICQRITNRPNFIGYSYKDEFINDGIENCIRYAKNFDPEKSNNPFAYFSQIAYFACIRRINREKKQMATKAKLVQQSGVLAIGAESFTQEQDAGNSYSNGYRDFLRDFYDVELLPEKEKKERKQKPSTTIDLTEL